MGAAAIPQQLRDLVSMECGVEGDSGACGSKRAKIRCHPTRRIAGEKCASCAGWQPVVAKPAANGFGHPLQFRIGVTFDRVASLDFNRNGLREPARTVLEPGVEALHPLRLTIQRKLA